MKNKSKRLTIFLSIIVIVFLTVIFLYIREKNRNNKNNDGYRKEEDISNYDCQYISYEDVIGTWKHVGTEDTYTGEIILLENGSIEFKGWRDANFSSSGIWELNKEELKMSFKDNMDYWSKLIDATNLNGLKEYHPTILEMSSDNDPTYVVKLEVINSHESCQTRMDFMGYYFYRK